MKSVGKVLKSILEIFIFAINVVLSLIVIVNLLVLLSSKVFNNEMPTLLDYTYYILQENSANFSFVKGDLLLIDTRKTVAAGDIVLYKNEKEYVLSLVKSTGDENSVIEVSGNDENVANDKITGIVIKKISKLGLLIDRIIQLDVFVISVAVLIVTSVIQSFMNRKSKKNKDVKPDFMNQKMY
ncbi:MAG: hypothetical protein HFI36_04630 [Bacilli bacterium]|jgi:hypothetical protein|nr:hypothetical protein [Bacilli bacterium]